jgi:rare lipoprotein A
MRSDPAALRHFPAWALAAIAAALLAGCASNPVESPAPSRAARDGADAQRSSRGNPPFYEVFGKRYYVLESSAGYRERGIASWYGRDFHGKRTSGGETYDMHDMTAAHKTLPIPTWVEVTNLENGKSVVVKVNDRGPFVDDRIIDLSYRAAQDLDMVRNGTARVQVRALANPNAAPLTTTAAATPERNGFSIISEAQADTLDPRDLREEQLFIQVGAFGDSDNAVKLVARLRRGGIPNSFIVSAVEAQGQIHRVRVGPLGSATEFDRVSDDLRALGLTEVRLVAQD